MPAVRNFAIYAAGAVIVNTALQVTIFVSAMAIDLRRIEVSRFVILRRLRADVYPQSNRVDWCAVLSQSVIVAL